MMEEATFLWSMRNWKHESKYTISYWLAEKSKIRRDLVQKYLNQVTSWSLFYSTVRYTNTPVSPPVVQYPTPRTVRSSDSARASDVSPLRRPFVLFSLSIGGPSDRDRIVSDGRVKRGWGEEEMDEQDDTSSVWFWKEIDWYRNLQ